MRHSRLLALFLLATCAFAGPRPGRFVPWTLPTIRGYFFAAPTVNTRYVDPDSAGDGDGTTNALSGANCAYHSLFDWEAARQADLVSGDIIEEAICDSTHANHTADTTLVVIDGWTTDATRYIDIKTSANGRHDGKWNTSKYRLEVGIASSAGAIGITESYVRLDGLQVSIASTGGTSYIYGVLINVAAAATTAETRISNCIIIKTGAGNASYHGGIYLAGANWVGQVWNTIIYDLNGGATSSYGIRVASGTMNAYNNTVQNSVLAYSRVAGTFTAKNCGAASCTTGFDGTIGQTTCSTTVPTFVDATGDNFHLDPTDTTWLGQGTSDPGSGLFTTDVDGQTITGTWHIGADWYGASARKRVMVITP